MRTSLLAAAEGGLLDTLGLNPLVVAVQVVIFVITFLVLSRILFKRVLEGLQRREAEIEAARLAAEKDRAELAAGLRHYEERMAQVDRAAYERAQETLRQGLAAAASVVATAQEQARKDVEQALADVAREKQEARARLKDDVARLSVEVVEKILETRLDPSQAGQAKAFLGGRA